MSFTRRVDTPWWAILHQRQHERLLRPLVALKQGRLEGPFSISGHLQFDRADSGRQFALVRSVPVALPVVGLLAGLGLRMFGHLRLQYLVEDRLQQDGHSSVASEQLMDLLVIDLDLNGGHRSSVWVG